MYKRQDYGFKFLFGREVEKELLIDFLNDLLSGEPVSYTHLDVYKRQVLMLPSVESEKERLFNSLYNTEAER